MRLREVLKIIEESSAELLGEATITRLHIFMIAWSHTAEVDPDDHEILFQFHRRIAQKYRIQSSHSWASIIDFYAPNEVEALGTAFRMWQEYFEFLEENPIQYDSGFSRQEGGLGKGNIRGNEPTLVALIQRIVEEPRKQAMLHFGSNTLTCFDAYLRGWMYGSGYRPDDVKILHGFQEKITKKYGISDVYWARLIRLYAANDVEALTVALKLWKEYLGSWKTSA